MNRCWWVAGMISLAVLGGCSKTEEEKTAASAPLPKDNVFSDQVQALEKAKAAEQALTDVAAKQQHAIDEQAGEK